MAALLITGASGFLGWNLCRVAQSSWSVIATGGSKDLDIPGVRYFKCDLVAEGAVERLLEDSRPDGVVHLAACSNANWCESHPIETQAINVEVPAALARICRRDAIPFVFTSTDLVFDGLAAPYREDSPVSPLNAYGRQKAEAEIRVLENYPEAVVCRMPLMLGEAGPFSRSYLQVFLEGVRTGAGAKLFVDEFRTPVGALSASRGLLIALEKGRGLLHLGGKERFSRYELGMALVQALGLENAKLIPASQGEVAMAAPRPPDVSLVSRRAFGLGYSPLPIAEELLQGVDGSLPGSLKN